VVELESLNRRTPQGKFVSWFSVFRFFALFVCFALAPPEPGKAHDLAQGNPNQKNGYM
jgi:hypothetical protein